MRRHKAIHVRVYTKEEILAGELPIRAGAWRYAWIQDAYIPGVATLCEVFSGGGWSHASADALDEQGFLDRDPDYYGDGMSHGDVCLWVMRRACDVKEVDCE